MKLDLLNLTSFALAAASGVQAADNPHVLRGSAEPDAASISLGTAAACADGAEAGRDDMKKAWKKMGQNCDDAWNLEDTADDLKENYPENPSNWKEKSYNECARDAIDAELKAIEKECFEDNSDQCTDLGEAAAEMIVFSQVCAVANSQNTHGQPDYKAACREMAYDICKGQISSVIDDYCPEDMPSTSGLRKLMKECPDQVDELLDIDNGPTPEDCVDDDRPRPVRKGQRFRFKLVDSDAQCVDKRDRLYEWGQFEDVENFSECAELCVNSVPETLATGGSFRGYDFNCRSGTCNCLYDEGTLDNRNSGRFTRTNRNEPGSGSISDTTVKKSSYCGKLVGAEFLEGQMVEA